MSGFDFWGFFGSPSAIYWKRIWIIWIISSTNENNIYIDRLRRLKEKEYTTEIWIIIILIRGIIFRLRSRHSSNYSNSFPINRRRRPKEPSKVETTHFRRSVIFGSFRTALTPVPTASNTRSDGIYRGKVTAERPLDDVGKDVSNVWNECK